MKKLESAANKGKYTDFHVISALHTSKGSFNI